MHRALNGKKSRNSSIVYKTFMGSMRVKTRKIPPVELDEKQRFSLLCTDEYAEHVSESPFLYLTCDLPPPPLFKDEVMENIIPQVKKMFEPLKAICIVLWLHVNKRFNID